MATANKFTLTQKVEGTIGSVARETDPGWGGVGVLVRGGVGILVRSWGAEVDEANIGNEWERNSSSVYRVEG